MHHPPVSVLVALSLLLFLMLWHRDFSPATSTALADEEISPQMPAANPETGECANTAAPLPEKTSIAPSPNAQPVSDLPSAEADLRQIEGWRDQGLITPEVYEQKRYDLQQIQTLLDRNLISPDTYKEKRRTILGEAQPAHSSPSPPSVNAHSRTADRLLELKGLLDQGLITPEEYKRKRETIIDEL
jgi:hypothetical protein